MKIKIIILGLISLFLFNRNLPFLYSQEFEGTYHEALRGLDLSKVRIWCELIQIPDKFALTNEMLEAYLETEMKKRGFKEINKFNSEHSFSIYPLFRVTLSPTPGLEDVLNIRLEIIDKVCSARDPKRKFEAIIWRWGGAIPIIRGTKQILDWFIWGLYSFNLDYKKSNPKK